MAHQFILIREIWGECVEFSCETVIGRQWNGVYTSGDFIGFKHADITQILVQLHTSEWKANSLGNTLWFFFHTCEFSRNITISYYES